jgi:type I restriction enzyme M protein
MSLHDRAHSLLFDAVTNLRDNMFPFEAAKCLAVLVQLRLIAEARTAYSELGLLISEKVGDLVRTTLAVPSPGAIEKTLKELERASSRHFEGVSQLVDLSGLSEQLLKQIIQVLSHPELSVKSPRDLLRVGEWVEHSLRQGALADRLASAYFSSDTLVHLMTELADVRAGHSVHDPTCGAGGGLAAAARGLVARGENPHSLSLSGQDTSDQALALCRLNLVTHGLVNFDLSRGDALLTPRFLKGDQLQRFDRVLNTPPWGVKRLDITSDPYGRFLYGEPPKGRADMAFLQHALAVTIPGGRAVLQMPSGVLFRSGAEQAIRRNLVHHGHLEAIIALPTNALPYTALPSALLVFEVAPKRTSKYSVEFVDAQSLPLSWREPPPDKVAQAIEQIVDAVRARREIAGFAHAASVQDIEANEFNLLPHVYTHTERQRLSLRELMAEIAKLEDSVQVARQELDNSIELLRLHAGTRDS